MPHMAFLTQDHLMDGILARVLAFTEFVWIIDLYRSALIRAGVPFMRGPCQFEVKETGVGRL